MIFTLPHILFDCVAVMSAQDGTSTNAQTVAIGNTASIGMHLAATAAVQNGGANGHDADVRTTVDAKETGRENKWRCSGKAIRVLCGAMLSNYVCALQWTAYGLYYVRLTEYFGVSKATAGWPGSLCVAVSCLSGKDHHPDCSPIALALVPLLHGFIQIFIFLWINSNLIYVRIME